MSTRILGQRDRRELLAAIVAGRVRRLEGRSWRYTGGHMTRLTKVPVARHHLDQLVDEGLVHVDADGTWRLSGAVSA